MWAPLNGGQSNTLTVDMAYIDVVVPKGDQLGLVIFGASPNWLVTIDGTSSQYDVDLGASSLTLPVVGSVTFANNAGDLTQVPRHVPAWVLPNPHSMKNRIPS